MLPTSDICGAFCGLGVGLCIRPEGHDDAHVAPHGRDCPHRCSMCAGVTPRRVTTDGAQLLIDGQPSGRTLDHERVITARRRAKR